MNKTLIAPSILSADFSNLASELKKIENANADWIHLDVMDGHFVPNMTFGPVVIKKIRACTQLPFDVHLMIQEPEKWINAYKSAGADRLTIHLESSRHCCRYLAQIKESQMASGISINPQTPASDLEYVLEFADQILVMTVNPGFGGQELIESVLKKIELLRKIIDKNGFKTLIQVDGGVNNKNMQRVKDAGADILVMGTAFFNASSQKQLVKEVHSMS